MISNSKRRLVSVAGIGIAATLLAGALSGCATKGEDNAPEMTLDPQNPNVRRAWLADLRLKGNRVEAVHATPDKLFVYTDQNQVYTLSRTGGSILWGSQIGDPFSSILPPLEVGDNLVFPVNTRMHLFDHNGMKVRAQEVGFAMHAPGVTDGKSLVFIPAAHNDGQRVAALDVTRQVGPIVWEFLTRGPVTASPAIHEGVIYTGSEDNRVYAVTTSRRPVWPLEGFAFETAGRIVADVKADDFGVYVASTDTKLYCLDRASGRIKWTYYGEAPLSTPPVVAGDTVYQFSPAKGLVAIDKDAGSGARTPKWTQPEAMQVLSVGDKGVYARFRDDTIGALEKNSGRILWRGSHKYQKFVTNMQDATIFAATTEGSIHAYLPVGENTPERVTRRSAAPATRPAAQPQQPAQSQQPQ